MQMLLQHTCSDSSEGDTLVYDEIDLDSDSFEDLKNKSINFYKNSKEFVKVVWREFPKQFWKENRCWKKKSFYYSYNLIFKSFFFRFKNTKEFLNKTRCYCL